MKPPVRALSTATALRSVIALLLAFNAVALAQNDVPPAPAAADTAASPQMEMQKWIATTDAPWQAVFKRDVTDVHEAEAKKLMLQYVNLLEDAIGKASKASDLDGAVALRKEQKRFGDTQLFPEQDEAADPAAVKQVRATIRAQLAKLKAESAARAKALHAKYDQFLAQAQAQLTQRQRFDDALLVKARRDEVAAAWLTPVPGGVAENPIVTTTPKPPAFVPKVPLGTKLGSVLAKVKAEDTILTRLEVGAAQNVHRNIIFTDIAKAYEGFQFTKAAKGGATLRFKVLSDGLVQMACTSRFGGGGSGGGWKNEVISEQNLQEKGWQRQPGVELKNDQPDFEWVIFTRTCKTGEQFSIRTEKYVPPILLVE